ncbi:MAG: uracil-DNA glycosylase [Crocinitomicaceae bacterium]
MIKILDLLPESWKIFLFDRWSEAERDNWEITIQSCLSKNTAPPIAKLFHAFSSCEPSNVKVVIIGQDPYPTFGHANGMAFSTEDFVHPFPKSLTNIFKELKRSIPNYDFPLTGNLQSWADQGVLLINTVLTTEIGIANAHKQKGWEVFTDLVLNQLNESSHNLVVFFWGKEAQAKMSFFDKEKHCLLSSSHPSPLSVYRGFDGCNHFVDCNAYLKSKKIPEINWQS